MPLQGHISFKMTDNHFKYTYQRHTLSEGHRSLQKDIHVSQDEISLKRHRSLQQVILVLI